MTHKKETIQIALIEGKQLYNKWLEKTRKVNLPSFSIIHFTFDGYLPYSDHSLGQQKLILID